MPQSKNPKLSGDEKMPSDELMYINWQDMIKPGKVQVSSKPNYGKFVCEPLERPLVTL